ncbi:MAG: NADP-dependent oxidoreductase [Salinarimonas sp.]
MPTNRRWVLAARPQGEPAPDDFRLETHEIEAAAPPDMVLVRNRHLSLDPYMRLRMNDEKSYVPPYELGETLGGQTIGEVVASGSADFKPGDSVIASGGWQDYALLPAKTVRRIDPDLIPPPAWLGVMGMPGFTAWIGLDLVGGVKAGETFVVGAATGPVGSMAGQLAKRAGARTIAIAGGAEKCALARDMFGFDAAIDHRDPDFAKNLAAACPDGIDVYFENIGGPVLETVLPLLNDFARIPVCGLVSHYNESAAPADATPLARLMRQVLVQRLSLRGFIVSDQSARYPDFLREVAPLVGKGEIRGLEDVVAGLENAPQALIGLLAGRNRGKCVIAIA